MGAEAPLDGGDINPRGGSRRRNHRGCCDHARRRERFTAPSLHVVDPERFTAGQRRENARETKATPSRQRDSSRDLAGPTGIIITKSPGSSVVEGTLGALATVLLSRGRGCGNPHGAPRLRRGVPGELVRKSPSYRMGVARGCFHSAHDTGSRQGVLGSNRLG